MNPNQNLFNVSDFGSFLELSRSINNNNDEIRRRELLQQQEEEEQQHLREKENSEVKNNLNFYIERRPDEWNEKELIADNFNNFNDLIKIINRFPIKKLIFETSYMLYHYYNNNNQNNNKLPNNIINIPEIIWNSHEQIINSFPQRLEYLFKPLTQQTLKIKGVVNENVYSYLHCIYEKKQLKIKKLRIENGSNINFNEPDYNVKYIEMKFFYLDVIISRFPKKFPLIKKLKNLKYSECYFNYDLLKELSLWLNLKHIDINIFGGCNNNLFDNKLLPKLSSIEFINVAYEPNKNLNELWYVLTNSFNNLSLLELSFYDINIENVLMIEQPIIIPTMKIIKLNHMTKLDFFNKFGNNDNNNNNEQVNNYQHIQTFICNAFSKIPHLMFIEYKIENEELENKVNMNEIKQYLDIDLIKNDYDYSLTYYIRRHIHNN